MIGPSTYAPEPWIRITYGSSPTGTSTIGPWSDTASNEGWLNISAVSYAEPPLTDVEKWIKSMRERAALVRLWSRLALAESTRVSRRLRARAPSQPPDRPRFSRRTCSQSSRWMVLQ